LIEYLISPEPQSWRSAIKGSTLAPRSVKSCFFTSWITPTNRYVARSGFGVSRQKRASQQRLRAQRLKKVPADHPAKNAVRYSIAGEIEIPGHPRNDLFEARVLLGVIQIIGVDVTSPLVQPFLVSCEGNTIKRSAWRIGVMIQALT
jgi:hypothetical protein